jgi:hypothetical protein
LPSAKKGQIRNVRESGGEEDIQFTKGEGFQIPEPNLKSLSDKGLTDDVIVKISNSHLNDLGAQVKEGIMSVVIENLDGVSVLRMSSRDVIKKCSCSQGG